MKIKGRLLRENNYSKRYNNILQILLKFNLSMKHSRNSFVIYYV